MKRKGGNHNPFGLLEWSRVIPAWCYQERRLGEAKEAQLTRTRLVVHQEQNVDSSGSHSFNRGRGE